MDTIPGFDDSCVTSNKSATSYSAAAPAHTDNTESSIVSPSAAAEIDVSALQLLSISLESVFDSPETFYSDAKLVLSDGREVPFHRCILAARSPFFKTALASAATVKLELKKIARDYEVGLDSVVAVLGYVYSGKVKPPPKGVSDCADEICCHVACRPAVEFMVEVLYLAFVFQIPQLVTLYQRNLLDVIDKVFVEDALVVLKLANICGEACSKLFNRCRELVVKSDIDLVTLEKKLPQHIVKEIIEIRKDLGFESLEVEKDVSIIHKALDSDDIALVCILLNESSTTLDDAYALHFAFAHCNVKIATDLLDLELADVNRRNPRGYTVLHVAAMRKEPTLVGSLLEKGANASDMTLDGRTALSIAKQVTKAIEYKNLSKQCKGRLCVQMLEEADKKRYVFPRDDHVIPTLALAADELKMTLLDLENREMLEQEDKLDPFARDVSPSLAVATEELRMRLLDLENRVALARWFFPMEAQVAMEIAQTKGTCEFLPTSLEPDRVTAGGKRTSSPEVKITAPFEFVEKHHIRLKALSKTVELGKRFFPRCSEELDRIMDCNELTELACGGDEDTPEKRLQKKQRYTEILENVMKAFCADKEAIGSSFLSASTSKSKLKSTAGKRSNVELGKRFFPRCWEVLDRIIGCEDLTQLACGEGDTPEKRLQKRQRYMEIQDAAMKAFNADKGEYGISATSESSGSAVLNPSSPATSAKTQEYREKLKEVQTPLQVRLPEHSSTGFDPILVISCGENQDSEETYFISCIFNELCLRGFTPRSYDLTRSTVTRNTDMLKKSNACIMIFSMNFARSRECLDEFVAIMDHLKGNNVSILLVFFEVSLLDVTSQSGSFGRAFSRLANSVQASQVLKWKAAMMDLTSINRYQYMKGHEIAQAKSIVRDVWFLLYSKTSRNLIGIKLLLESILPLLRCPQPSAPHIVGLWGMAGIGKTAITREIFRKQAERYDASYFLPDFHLMCQTKGLSHLRDEFFSKIFGEEKVFIDACDTKISFTKERFLDKRLLLVLDGVTNARDVEVLVGGLSLFSGGHTIILTSRNRQVLVQCKVNELYEIPKLSKTESLCLFRQYQTESNQKRSMTLISELVNYANGIPLALQVLSSSVQEKFVNNEKEHLRKLRQYPPVEIQDAFRKSFDGLHDNERNIFLDLACFFRGASKDHVVNILDGCGFSTDLGFYALIDGSLIGLVDNKIEMPNIFQDTGRFVVCQENNEAGKRSRLWDSDDIADVLTNKTGTEAIEGIFLDVSRLKFELSPSVFERMYRLRLLKLYCATSENHCNVYLPQGLRCLPDELRLLHWERYPLGSLPRNFNPKNLVELNMPYSNLKKLWKGTKNLERLKRIILSHSRQLTKFPRLSKAMNLEYIDLEGCTSLVKVNSSIIYDRKLTFLSLKDCSHLQIMPTTVHLESLEVLNLSGCSELKDLQDFSPNLKELYLAGTAIREMPSSIGDLTRLVTLDLENCERLEHLPPWISNLKAMVTLKLAGCSNLKSLPTLDALFLRDPKRLNTKITMEESTPLKLHSGIQESSRDAVEEILPQESWPRVTVLPSSILHSLASRLYTLVSLFVCNAYLVDIPEELSWLASMKALDLGGNPFSQIPKSMKELRKLESLRLRNCKNLRSLPELPRSLVILNAHGCASLESFPSSFEQFPRHYTFSNCFNLSPKVVRKYIGNALDSVEGMAKEHLQEHKSAPAFSICIPASADHISSVNFQAGSSVRIELTPDMLKTLSGFALSVVVEFWDNYCNTAGFGIKCICKETRTDLSTRRLERIFQFWAPKESPTIKKDHMFLFGYVKRHTSEGNDLGLWADLVTFELHPVNAENQLLNDSCTVKRCGVYLITEATCDTALSAAKRPSSSSSSSSSSMDPWELSSVEHMAPPYKRGRLKRVIQSVILNLQKRKREESVSTVENRSKFCVGTYLLLL